MKFISLSGLLAGKDSFNYLYPRGNAVARQLAKLAADAEVLQKYALEQFEAKNAHSALIANFKGVPTPEVVASANRLKKAEDAFRANQPRYDDYVKRFQGLIPKLETEYTKAKSIMVADQAQFGKEYPPKPKQPPIVEPAEVSAQASLTYDPNYANANSRGVEQVLTGGPGPLPPIINDPNRVTTQITNRRPTPKRPRPQPPARRRPVPPQRGTVNNSNVPKNPIVNTSRACPPGTTGTSIDNGCTDSTGATFIA